MEGKEETLVSDCQPGFKILPPFPGLRILRLISSNLSVLIVEALEAKQQRWTRFCKLLFRKRQRIFRNWILVAISVFLIATRTEGNTCFDVLWILS
jgi:hypothetical protein